MLRGRPKFEEGKARDAMIKIRVTPREVESYKRAARAANCSVSEWAREMLNRVWATPAVGRIARKTTEPLVIDVIKRLPPRIPLAVRLRALNQHPTRG